MSKQKDVNMIIKQKIGNGIYLGGPESEITPLNFSCYNFNQNFNSDLMSLGGDFFYFIVTEKDYVKARARNKHFNWEYSNPDGTAEQKFRRTRMARKLAILQAKKELASFKEDDFIFGVEKNILEEHSFGTISEKLEKINNNEEIIKDKKLNGLCIDDAEEEKEMRVIFEEKV